MHGQTADRCIRRHADRQDHLGRHRGALCGHTAEGPPIRRSRAAVQAPPDPRRRRDPGPGRLRRHRQITIRHAGAQPAPREETPAVNTTAAPADPRRHATQIPARHHPRHLLRRPAHRRGLRAPTRRHRPRQPFIHIRRTRLTRARVIAGPPKTARSKRTEPIPEAVIPEIRAHLAEYVADQPDAWDIPSPLDHDRPIETDAMREAYIKARHRPDAKTSDSTTCAPPHSPCSHRTEPPSANSWPPPATARPPWPCTTSDSAKTARALADKVAASITPTQTDTAPASAENDKDREIAELKKQIAQLKALADKE